MLVIKFNIKIEMSQNKSHLFKLFLTCGQNYYKIKLYKQSKTEVLKKC